MTMKTTFKDWQDAVATGTIDCSYQDWKALVAQENWEEARAAELAARPTQQYRIDVSASMEVRGVLTVQAPNAWAAEELMRVASLDKFTWGPFQEANISQDTILLLSVNLDPLAPKPLGDAAP